MLHDILRERSKARPSRTATSIGRTERERSSLTIERRRSDRSAPAVRQLRRRRDQSRQGASSHWTEPARRNRALPHPGAPEGSVDRRASGPRGDRWTRNEHANRRQRLPPAASQRSEGPVPSCAHVTMPPALPRTGGRPRSGSGSGLQDRGRQRPADPRAAVHSWVRYRPPEQVASAPPATRLREWCDVCSGGSRNSRSAVPDGKRRSGSRRLSSVMKDNRSSFNDPRAALEKEFEAARGQLRQAQGPSRSLLGAVRLFMAERKLHHEMVTKPLRSAHW
jgi:hypothetical protein